MSKKFFSAILLGIVVFSSAEAAFEERGKSARAIGMGGAFTGVSDDGAALYWNPAGLIQANFTQLSTSHTNLFGLTELGHTLLNLVTPLANITIGLSFQDFGSLLYSEKTSIFAIAWEVGERTSLGVSAKKMDLKIEGYGQDFGVGMDFGLLWKITEDLKIGVYKTNLNTPVIGEKVERILKIGASWEVLPFFLWSADVEKSEKLGVELRVGQEVWLSETFCARMGYQKDGNRITGGFGIKTDYFHLDYAFLTHPKLGPTHLFSLTKLFGEK